MTSTGDRQYHLGRLLLLLRAFGPPTSSGLDGLTKLAKLDFLLRYPVFADRLLRVQGSVWPDELTPDENETLAVESKMVRYKYGPWDDRYYPLVGALLGTGLAEDSRGRGRVTLKLTEDGYGRANILADDPLWSIIAARAVFLQTQFDLSGSQLKDLIYEHLPDAVDRPHREEIV